MSNIENSAQHQYTDDELADLIAAQQRDEIVTTDETIDQDTADLYAPVWDGITDAEKLDFLYRVAVEVKDLIATITPADIAKTQKVISNPYIRKLMGL